MNKMVHAALCLSLLLMMASSAWAENPRVLIKTTAGDIELELDIERAPISVHNFLGYVDDGSYVGTVFHRVIPGFMIQSGGHLEDLTEIEAREPIRNEADNGLKNLEGTIAMARMDEIDSASRQFFINVSDNTHLDHSSESCTRDDQAAQLAAREKGLYKPLSCKSYGYAVFGRVTAGMDVVHKIEIVATEMKMGFMDVPVEPITIKSVARVAP